VRDHYEASTTLNIRTQDLDDWLLYPTVLNLEAQLRAELGLPSGHPATRSVLFEVCFAGHAPGLLISVGSRTGFIAIDQLRSRFVARHREVYGDSHTPNGTTETEIHAVIVTLDVDRG